MFEDFAKLSANLASGLYESSKNISEGVRSKANSFAKSADLVTRDEFEVVKNMAGRIRLENETILKDMSELKKQMQTMASSIDVIKEQVSKGGSVGGSIENNDKLMEDLRVFGENVESKINEFESASKLQQAEIEKLYLMIEAQSAKQEKPHSKAKKVENSNPSLFGDDQEN